MKLLYVLILLITTVAVTIKYSVNEQDDAYIYYSYAKNIAAGNGYVFNPGERVNATTGPLYPLVLAAVSRATGIPVPLIGTVLTGIGLFTMALFVFLLIPGVSRYAAPFVLLMFPPLYHAMGMEVTLALGTGLAAVYCYLKGHQVPASALLAVAVLFRPDMTALVAVVLAHRVISTRKLPAVKTVLIFAAIVSPWLVFSKIYFGSIIPASVAIKSSAVWSMQFDPSPWSFISALVEPAIYRSRGAMRLVVGLFIPALVVVLVKWRSLKPFETIVLAWSAIYLVTYGFILHTIEFAWYYSIFSIPFSIILCKSIETFHRKIRNAGVVVAILVVAFCLSCFSMSKVSQPWKYRAYRHLAAKLMSGKRVAVAEVGILRYYYKGGNIYDLVGLTTAETGNDFVTGNLRGILENSNADFTILSEERKWKPLSGFDRIIADPWFKKTWINCYKCGVDVYMRRTE